MPAFRTLLLAAALATSLPVLAQEPSGTDLKQQMGAEEFKAAGLDKLSVDELQRLNAWLNRKTIVETAKAMEKAKEEGRQEVVRKNRGFFDFGSSEPIVATLAGEFHGFGKGRQYVLDNGQVWRQLDSATLHGVHKTNPKVSIRPGVLGAWYMTIDGYNTRASVRREK